eukprot:CAMPEP_0203851000 /NCGR_PEP_ID=MMETSP0359-20131031/7090_1 /ASSEMBLY_ACC=CAM_ASM_000338 /TAXON_ID=268821 /ORGANISM="Scrippsiella Hangoei, Strain SHTV-5" /LENGTH=229 /DNA_ID=CAMNT_0050766957 /DNA_START=38 /DNA_END=727 /DNA_ORIENTATION=+
MTARCQEKLLPETHSVDGTPQASTSSTGSPCRLSRLASLGVVAVCGLMGCLLLAQSPSLEHPSVQPRIEQASVVRLDGKPHAAGVEVLGSGEVGVVKHFFADWGAGKLNGPGCRAAAQELALDDALFDATSDAMPHVEGAKVYVGLQGLCDFASWLLTFNQPDYKIVEMLHNGQGVVAIKESFTPTVIRTGKSLDHATQNILEFGVKDGKLASMKVFWGEPRSFDALFV